MFYKEEIINGVLCYQTTPHGKWKEFSKKALTEKHEKLKQILTYTRDNLEIVKALIDK